MENSAAIVGDRVGPYRLSGVLGEGGMGVVFDAVHDNGERVALKMLHVPRPGLIESIQREIRALAALDHPGIVRIVEHGLYQDCPWYAMERIEGVSLRAWLDSEGGETMPHTDDSILQRRVGSPALDHTLDLDEFRRQRGDAHVRDHVEVCDVTLYDMSSQEGARLHAHSTPAATSTPSAQPLSLPTSMQDLDILSVLEHVCWALAFLHGQGLVHRDIKPSNILIQPSGKPVLVDFGLALRVAGRGGRENLDVVSKTAGTALYMAPEQVLSTDIDARADLYALGCILYEALCGVAPFDGASPLVIMIQHTQDAPRTLRARGCVVSDELEDLVARLLSKDRAKRPGYAQDVARTLSSLQGFTAPSPHVMHGLRTYLYRPALVGRERQLKMLEHASSTLTQTSPHGSFVCLRGPQGMGKTRLAVELVESARSRHMRVLSGSGEPPGALFNEQAFGGVRALIDPIADSAWNASPDRAQTLLGRDAAALAEVIPSVRRVAQRFQWPQLSPLRPNEERLRLLHSFHAFVQNTVRGATVLVLDDAQWLDDLTLDWLDMVLHTNLCARIPLLILLVFRDESLPGALRTICEHPNTTEIRLGPLGAEELSQVVGSMLSLPSPPKQIVRTIHTQSAGNPLYVAEILRCAAQIGALQRTPEGLWTLSDLLQDTQTNDAHDMFCVLIGQLIDALPSRSQTLLRMCSVIGREVPLDLVQAALPFSLCEEDWDPIEAALLLSLDDQNKAIFLYNIVKEVAYQSLPEEERVLAHRAVAQALVPRTQSAPDLEAVCAYHWFQAHNTARALEHNYRAALDSIEHSNLARAVALLELYLDHADPEDTKVPAVLCHGATALFSLGEFQRSLDWSERVQECVELENEYGRKTCLSRANGLYELSRFEESNACLDRLEQISLSTKERVDVLHQRASNAIGTYALKEAFEIAERALQLANEDGDADLRASSLSTLAAISFRMGALHATCDFYERAIALCRTAGTRRREGILMSNLASVFFRLGQFDRAQAVYVDALEIHREVENISHEASTLSNLASARRKLGIEASVEGLYTRALAIHRATNAIRSQAVTLTNLATFHHDRGELALAFVRFQEALPLHEEAQNQTWFAYTHILLAALHRHRDQVERAILSLDHAQDVLKALQNTSYYDVLALCERGHVALMLGDVERAEAMMARARVVIEEIDAPEQSPPRVSMGRLGEALESQGVLVAGQVLGGLNGALRRVVENIFEVS